VAKKAVPCIDRKGQRVAPKEPNAAKWEMFIFDILGEARNHVALEADRTEEFEPLKNGSGPVYTPETVRAALSARSARWLEAAGVAIQKDAQGRPVGKFEVSPLTALGPEYLKKKLAKQKKPEPKDGALAV
jgi:UDP-N-acetylglucosamine/UDP-N-acetylgalactosamine diphosphorylase